MERYLISASVGGWVLSLGGHHLSKFPEKPQAIRTAVAMASTAAQMGGKAEVIGTSASGERYTIWSHERDGFSRYP